MNIIEMSTLKLFVGYITNIASVSLVVLFDTHFFVGAELWCWVALLSNKLCMPAANETFGSTRLEQ